MTLTELRYLLDFASGLGHLKGNDYRTLSGSAVELNEDLRRLHESLA